MKHRDSISVSLVLVAITAISVYFLLGPRHSEAESVRVHDNSTSTVNGEPPAATDNSNIGDVVMSVLSIAEFRKVRGDKGPNFRWYAADGKPLPVTVGTLKVAPDFQGRYPRGWSPTAIPNPAAGETGAVGTNIAQAIQKHEHTTTWGMSGFDNDDDQGRAAAVFRGANFGNGMETTNKSGGGDETRPNSVVMYFYIRVR